jgi:hypothetical protein
LEIQLEKYYKLGMATDGQYKAQIQYSSKIELDGICAESLCQ